MRFMRSSKSTQTACGQHFVSIPTRASRIIRAKTRRVRRCLPVESTDLREPRGAFGGFIGPRTLMAQVWNTAPWLLRDAVVDDTRRPLIDRVHAPLGWRDVLAHAHQVEATDEPTEAQWLDYFALCVAAHFATCATHVPTDVDTKIRGHLWFHLRSDEARAKALDMAEALATWDIRSVSARTLTVPSFGTISGHDGERLSVLAGGLLRCLVAKDVEGARRMDACIQAELQREADVFRTLCAQPGRELDVARVAANLTHNAGDLDQGLSSPDAKRVGAAVRQRVGRLAHERIERFGGAFAQAAAVNRTVMAPEAHRHYPLRKIALLREDARWLRPAGPFLDEWGTRLAQHRHWSKEQRGSILEGLLMADAKVKGQRGYARALVGFARGSRKGLDLTHWKAHLGAAARRHLKRADVRQRLSVTRASFEGTVANEVRKVVVPGPL